MADDQIPERVSATRDHPDFYPHYRRVIVLLDGQPMRFVKWADRVAGVVEHYQPDDRGRLMSRGDEFLVKRSSGAVRFLLRGGARG